jgi:CBS domain containing-hemolysin-like protein
VTPLVLFLLGCATIFLGSVEAAFSALMRLSLRLMAERGGRSDLLGYYLDEPLKLFIPLRLLIAVITLIATILIAPHTGVDTPQALAALLAAVVGFIVVCEHLVPMVLVRRDPERALDLLLPVFHPLARVVRPLTHLLIGIIEGRRERDGAGAGGAGEAEPPATPAGQEEEEHAISEEEGRELLQSIVDFTETVVREVMTPRPDIVAIRSDATLAALRDLFREQQYSRVPVYGGNLDNIVGMVFVKDLVALAPGAEPPLTALMRPAYFVPESKRVSELLKELQRKQAHMAIVVDEYGGTAGLVTVEDLLEEIVGEIRDEYDVESETVTDEGNGTFVFSGKVSVDEVADRLGVRIEREGFETVGGFLLSHLGRMPYLGERFHVDGLEAEVLEVERRRINKVRMRRRAPELEEAGQ